MVKFLNVITHQMNRGTTTIACSLDVEQAYDKVWADGSDLQNAQNFWIQYTHLPTYHQLLG